MRHTAPDELAAGSEVHIHQGAGCKFGGCALKAVILITGGLLYVLKSGLRVKRFTLIVRQKSAAGIVDAQALKAQTEGSGK